MFDHSIIPGYGLLKKLRAADSGMGF